MMTFSCDPCDRLGEHQEADGAGNCVCCGRPITDDCPTCGGAGEIPVLPIPDDPQEFETRPCIDCDGTGEVTLARLAETEETR